MQTWPALRNLKRRSAVAARVDVGVVEHDQPAAWPPSSMVVRFMYCAASAARCLPTGTEPVNEILRTSGEGIRCSETSAGTP